MCPAYVGPSLPVDLMIKILSRLPVKVLCKFKSVSKQWLSVITDTYFTQMHRAHSLENPNLLLLRKTLNGNENGEIQNNRTKIDARSIDLNGNCNYEFSLNVDDNVELLPSKWDLICFAGENGFYVCNPSTHELLKLPEANCCTSGEINAGMGYIHDKNEYVLIHLFDRSLVLNGDYDIGCEIIRLSSKNGSIRACTWKVVDANCLYVVRDWGVLAENVFYWMIWDEYDHPGTEAIVSFDLENENFDTISPPEGCFDPNCVWILVELRGFLCLVDKASKPSTMDIWMLKDKKNHLWVKEYSIDLNGFNDRFLKFIVPLGGFDGEIVMDLKLESVDYYYLEKKRFEKLENMISRDWTWLRLYNESFFSLGNR